MLKMTLRGISARRTRSILTGLAVFFGVAMIAGTLMLTDSVNSSFDDIFTDVNSGVDVSVSTRETIEDSRGALPPPLDEAVLEDVRAVAGVADAAGSVFDPTVSVLDENGDRVGTSGPPHFAGSVVPERFSPWTYVEGRGPESSEEIAVDSFSAEREIWSLGDTVRIAGTGAAREYTIVGVGEFGSGVELLGATLTILTLDEAQSLTGKQGQLDEIVVAADEGVLPEELKLAVENAVTGKLEVRTGAENAAEGSAEFKDGFAFLSIVLTVFGVIALFVGGFIIFNTFSITVAQRTREFGMLRTLGAHRRQVLGAVLLEAAVIGLVASVLGLAGGIGFVEGIAALFGVFGLELPSSGLVLSPSTVIIALAVGTGVTVVASLAPARRATKVTALEALREGGQQRDSSRRRALIGSGLLGLGVLLIALGMFAADSFSTAFTFLGPGILLLFLGVALLSSRLIGPIASVVGWPLQRFGGVPGKLARENTLRNRSRTATTAAALMIGLALVVFVATFASALNKSVDEALNDQFAGDLILNDADNGLLRIPVDTAEAVRAIEGVAVVSPIAGGDARVEGVSGTHTVSGLDPGTVATVSKLDWQEGSDAILAELGPSGAIIESDWGADNGVAVGDTIRVTTPLDVETRYTVRGSVRDQASLLVSSFAIPRETLLRHFGVEGDNFTLVGFAEGTDFEAVRARIDGELGG